MIFHQIHTMKRLLTLILLVGWVTPCLAANESIRLPDGTTLNPITKPREDLKKAAKDILVDANSMNWFEWSEKSGAAADRIMMLELNLVELGPETALRHQIDNIGLGDRSDPLYGYWQKNVGWRAISFSPWVGTVPWNAKSLGSDFSKANTLAWLVGDLNAGIWVSGDSDVMLGEMYLKRIEEVMKRKPPEQLTIHFGIDGRIEIFPPDVRVDLKLLLINHTNHAIITYEAIGSPSTKGPTSRPTILLGDFGLGNHSVELEKPVQVDVALRVAPGESIRGPLLRYDHHTLTVKTSKSERTMRWTDLVPGKAVSLRTQLIDKSKAKDWLALGEFAWALGVKEPAKNAFANATKMEPKLAGAVDRAQNQDAGWAIKGSDKTGGVAKYQKPTPAEDAAAIAGAKEDAAKVEAQLKVRFKELQTAHFLIFTDWDPREYDFLKQNLENAYSAVSKQFELPVNQNIFLGKLPVYMFIHQKDFMDAAEQIDQFPLTKTVAGYYCGREDGTGHMRMWKPDTQGGRNTREAEMLWAYVLTHEFTHAFVARYRTNRHIPTWLNEGIAEVIASSTFPSARTGIYRTAREMADKGSIKSVFEEGLKKGEWYPVMRTLTETMLKQDRAAFLKMFDDIKEGQNEWDALKTNFGWSQDDLERAWREHIRK